VYRTMISRPGPLSLDASSRLNHRAFASVINLVPLLIPEESLRP
jgi:hypothetical protein